MRVEVINTGTELLLGNVVNTHLAFLARELFPLRIQRQATVPDGGAIRQALEESFARADLVLVTGGLGPTTDDITRDIVSELLGLPLLQDPAVLAAIVSRFARRGFSMTERVKRQAEVPRGAAVLANAHGTAPGLYFPRSARSPHLFLLPGPPRELEPMFQNQVTPILRGLLPSGTGVESRVYKVIGLGESVVEEKVGREILAIEGIELGYCARPGAVDVRCIGTGAMLERAHSIMNSGLRENIVSSDGRSLEEVVVALLTERGERLALAESCTGGFVANQVTNVPGSSEVFVEGFVTYANRAKTRSLGIDERLLAAHGAVSAEVAAAMAVNARERTGVEHALSLTGIAGPGGGTKEKPVGTVFIGLASVERKTEVHRHRFPTDRETFKSLASQAALDQLRRRLLA